MSRSGRPIAERSIVGGPRWAPLMLSTLGVAELAIALGTAGLPVELLGAVCAAVLIVAPWFIARMRSAPAVLLLVLGSVPFAALTWFSIVTPALSIVALAIGNSLLRHRAHP